jgi:Ca-activated chloride channel family protein
MIRFSHAWVLWLHLALPLLAWLAWREAGRPRRLLAHGGAAARERLLPGWSRPRALLRGLAALLGLACWITAVAGPQLGTRQVEVERTGVDVVVAVDVSQSMAAQDLAPDRMARARHSIRQLLSRMKGDRVALLPFAGATHLQHPLTSDYALAGVMTDLLRPGLLPVPGSDLGGAIRRAMGVYQDTAPGQRVLIILSDGEDLEGNWEEALVQAREAGVTIHTVGMGTPEGAPLPDPQRPGSYKTDRQGSIVFSRLDEAVLQRMAAEGGGLYLRSTPGGDELVRILERVGEMEGRRLGSRMYAGWQDRFAVFLLPGMLLVLGAWWWPARRRLPAAGLALIALLTLAASAGADQASENNRALRAYRQGDHGAATEGFGRALALKENAQIRFNLGDALFRSGDLDGAAAQFRLAAGEGSGADADLAARAYANLGRVLLDQKRPQEAAQALEEALVRRPGLAEARHNLELALRQMQDGEGQGDPQDGEQGEDGQKQDQGGGQSQDEEQKGEEGQDGQPRPSQDGQQDEAGRPREARQDEAGQAADSSAQARPLDPDQLQQLLNAVGAQERQSLERQLQRLPGERRRVEKDW